MGFIAAAICVLAWGSYLVPLKKYKECEPLYFQALQAVGIVLSTLLITIINGLWFFSWWGVLSGTVWAIGSIMSLFAVRKEGLAAASAGWMGVGIFMSFLWGVFFFKENINSTALAIVGLILLFTALISINNLNRSANSKNTDIEIAAKPRSKFKIIGLTSLLAGMMFGSYLVPLNLSGLSEMAFLPSMSLGIAFGSFLAFLIQRPAIYKPVILPAIGAGVIWNIANIASFFAITNLGFTIGFPLTQTSLFVAVLWGVILFNEIPGKSNRKKLVFYAMVLFSGAILLAFSKGL